MQKIYRTFIGIKIPQSENLLKTYEFIVKKLFYEKINWVPPENFHITLSFIGDTSEKEILTIENILNSITPNYHSIDLQIKDFGVFPNTNNPRVIWFGIQTNETIYTLQDELNEALIQNNINPDTKPFKPHLTIGRVKEIGNTSKIIELQKNLKNKVLFTGKVNEITLFESILSSNGAVYRPLKTFYLKNE